MDMWGKKIHHLGINLPTQKNKINTHIGHPQSLILVHYIHSLKSTTAEMFQDLLK
jgi:hypothetical protein